MKATSITHEQLEATRQAGDFKLVAVAGSGKTTTLIEYAASRPVLSSGRSPRILYLAFNRTVRLEAQARFARRGLTNVTVHTAHSLAYSYVIVRQKYVLSAGGDYSIQDIAAQLGFTQRTMLAGCMMASHVKKLFSYFCNSKAVTVEQLDYLAIIDPADAKSRRFARQNKENIYRYAQQLYTQMDTNKLPCTHDFYLKKFQFIAPPLPYDYILFDEGQDASETMLEVFMQQPATKLIVGDPHQQIYGFRHAVNSLDKFDAPTLYLSQSFRFGDEVAQLANYVLGWKSSFDTGQLTTIKGVGKHQPPVAPIHATIGRTNVAVLAKAIDMLCIEEQIGSLYFEGRFETYIYMDSGGSLMDIYYLNQDRLDRVRSPLIKTMGHVGELKQYVDQTGEASMRLALEIVETYQDALPEYIEQIRQAHVDDSMRHVADQIFSTVHRCKGMEYDGVTLCDDFIEKKGVSEKLADKQNPANLQALHEEINMLYVALTRSRQQVRIPDTLRASFSFDRAALAPVPAENRTQQRSESALTGQGETASGQVAKLRATV